jgi:hypothetical protein
MMGKLTVVVKRVVLSLLGMTLRDYFAAKAMQAMIAKSTGVGKTAGKYGVPLIASYAYEYADAMLAERAK